MKEKMKKTVIFTAMILMMLCFNLTAASESQAKEYKDVDTETIPWAEIKRDDVFGDYGKVTSTKYSNASKTIRIIRCTGGSASAGSIVEFKYHSQRKIVGITFTSAFKSQDKKLAVPGKIGGCDVYMVKFDAGGSLDELDVSASDSFAFAIDRELSCKYLLMNDKMRGIDSPEKIQDIEYIALPNATGDTDTRSSLRMYKLDKYIISRKDYDNYIAKGLPIPTPTPKPTPIPTPTPTPIPTPTPTPRPPVNTAQRKKGSYIYAHIDYDTCRVISYMGDKETLSIPSTFDGKDVVKIETDFIKNKSKVKTLTIPNTVTEIAEKAFYECTALETINMSTGVVNIGKEAFKGCSKFTSITLPDTLKTIGEKAFYECKKLKAVTIPKNVTKVGISAFDGCSALSSVTINSNGADFTENVFRSTPWLNGEKDALVVKGNSFIHKNKDVVGEYTVPTGCTVIPNWAFMLNSKLTKITIPNTVTTIGHFAFLRCNGLTELTIPGSVKKVCEYSFGECAKLEKVVISEGVETLYGLNGYQYNGLFNLSVAPEADSMKGRDFCVNPTGQDAFKELYLPASLKDFYFTNDLVPKGINMGEMFFLPSNKNLMIYVPENSFAEKLCEKRGLKWSIGSPDEGDEMYRGASAKITTDDLSINKDSKTTSKTSIIIVICVIVVIVAGTGVIIYKKKKK